MKPARLLRWYPPAWRERYGEELLALIQDTLDEGEPAWRLRLGVIWGGLRERGHQARHPGKARLALVSRWLTRLQAGLIVPLLAEGFTQPAPMTRAWQAAAFDAMLAAVALAGAVVVACGLPAVPQLVAVAPATVTLMPVTTNLWWSATQTPVFLIMVPVLLGSETVRTRLQIGRAVRRGRRLHAAAGGAVSHGPRDRM